MDKPTQSTWVTVPREATETLDDLIARARTNYAALSPVDRAIADAAQARSFVRGQFGTDPGPDVLAEEVLRLRAMLAAPPPPAVDREAVAKFVFGAMRWAADVSRGTQPVPRWVVGGNSLAQDEARRCADKIIALISSTGGAE